MTLPILTIVILGYTIISCAAKITSYATCKV